MQAHINQAYVLDEDFFKPSKQNGLVILPPTSTAKQTQSDRTEANKRRQIYAALAASMGAYCLGCLFGWSSSVQKDLTRRNTTLDDGSSSIWHLQITDDELSWASSLVNIGALLGSLGGGSLMDKFGRRATLMAMAFPFLIGSLMLPLAVNATMLYVGRLIGGCAAGISSAVAPCYIGEISTPDMRGVVGMFFSAGLSLGVFVASVLAWLKWRLVSAILAVQPLLLFLAMFLVPESPHFLVKKGRLVEAEKALKWLRGETNIVETELNQIKERIRVAEDASSSPEPLLEKVLPWPIFIGVAMMIFMQFSGLNAALFYSIEIFQLADSSLDPAVCAVIVKGVQVCMNVLSSMFLVQRFGRKTLHAGAEAMATISLFILGGYFYMLNTDPERVASLGWLPLVCLMGYICAVALGVAPLAWVVSNEVLPSRLRSIGSSIAAFTSWSSAFIVTKTFLDIQRSLTTAGVFWIYGGFCFIGLLFSSFLLPETKGKTPEEIQALLSTRKDRNKPESLC